MLSNIGQLLPAPPRRLGDRTALVCNGRVFSFTELDILSARLARSFQAPGVRNGDRVTLYSPNSWEWVVSSHAIARAGAVINPVNALLTPDEVRYVIENCGASVLLPPSDNATHFIEKRPACVHEIIAFGGDEALSGACSFEALLDAPGVGKSLGGAADASSLNGRPDDLSTICYTSGTTGYPKGAILSLSRERLAAYKLPRAVQFVEDLPKTSSGKDPPTNFAHVAKTDRFTQTAELLG